MNNYFRNLFRDPRLIGLLLLVASIFGIGTVFYSQVEHWRVLDSLYFSVITLTTIGYGDFTPQTDVGKLFTIGYILVGIGVILSLLAIIANHAINNYHKLTISYLIKSKTEKDDTSNNERAGKN